MSLMGGEAEGGSGRVPEQHDRAQLLTFDWRAVNVLATSEISNIPQHCNGRGAPIVQLQFLLAHTSMDVPPDATAPPLVGTPSSLGLDSVVPMRASEQRVIELNPEALDDFIQKLHRALKDVDALTDPAD